MSPYCDVIVVGAGLTGATIARMVTDRGRRCLVLERRKAVGGNCRDTAKEGINVHLYGPHIFHTSSQGVWNFVRRFTEFNHFRYSPLARHNGRLYSLPFNMHTFYQLFGCQTPNEARQRIERECYPCNRPCNIEEKALSTVGSTIFDTLIKGYTEKQWGRPCRELPPEIIGRIPLRFTFDNNYFNDIHQGIPIGGYSQMIRRMLDGIEVRTGVDFINDASRWIGLCQHVVYTGAVDELCGHALGRLEYRSLRWEHHLLDCPDWQGVAVINETAADIPHTRTIEHKHFEFGQQPITVVSKEYPQLWLPSCEPFYPINDENNQRLYDHYKQIVATQMPSVTLSGRLATYRYLNMDQAIAEALAVADSLTKP